MYVILYLCLIIARMPLLAAHLNAVVDNISRRHGESAFQRERGEVSHMGATAATQLVDYETATL